LDTEWIDIILLEIFKINIPLIYITYFS
jgi:hypothetical protein